MDSGKRDQKNRLSRKTFGQLQACIYFFNMLAD